MKQLFCKKWTSYSWFDQGIDEPTLVRNNENNDFDNQFLSTISQVTLTWEPTDVNHAVSKAYVDSLTENVGSRQDMSTVFSDQGNEFDNNNLTILDSIRVNRNRFLDDELSKEHMLMYKIILKFQLETIFSMLQHVVEKQILDITIFKIANAFGYLLE